MRTHVRPQRLGAFLEAWMPQPLLSRPRRAIKLRPARGGRVARGRRGEGDWNKDGLRALLDANKDGNGATITWSAARLPTSGRLMCATTWFAVAVDERDLLVRATWKGPEEQQVYIQLPHASWNLARLCLTRIHSAEPHWHAYDNAPGGIDQQCDALTAPAGPEAMDDLLAFFIAKQHITNVTVERPLFES